MVKKKKKKKRRPSIKSTILQKLSDGKQHSIRELTKSVIRSGYKSRTGYGTRFARERTDDALYKLIHYEKKVTRPRKGYYRLRKRK